MQIDEQIVKLDTEKLKDAVVGCIFTDGPHTVQIFECALGELRRRLNDVEFEKVVRLIERSLNATRH